MHRLAGRGRVECSDTSEAQAPREGDAMGSDYSALFYVLVAIILVAKFYVGNCGCG